MTNANMPAAPLANEIWLDPTDPKKGTVDCYGLTKREHIAAMAMQGMTGLAPEMTHRDVADHAVKYADALLAALEVEA